MMLWLVLVRGGGRVVRCRRPSRKRYPKDVEVLLLLLSRKGRSRLPRRHGLPSRFYFLGRFVCVSRLLRRTFLVLAALDLFSLVVDVFCLRERSRKAKARGAFLTKAALFGLAFVLLVSFLLPSSFFPLRPPLLSLRERSEEGVAFLMFMCCFFSLALVFMG